MPRPPLLQVNKAGGELYEDSCPSSYISMYTYTIIGACISENDESRYLAKMRFTLKLESINALVNY